MQIPPSGGLPKVNGEGSSQIQGNKSINNDKVKQLRDAIANGTYQVNTGKIADSMIRSGILND